MGFEGMDKPQRPYQGRGQRGHMAVICPDIDERVSWPENQPKEIVETALMQAAKPIHAPMKRIIGIAQRLVAQTSQGAGNRGLGQHVRVEDPGDQPQDRSLETVKTSSDRRAREHTRYYRFNVLFCFHVNPRAGFPRLRNPCSTNRWIARIGLNDRQFQTPQSIPRGSLWFPGRRDRTLCSPMCFDKADTHRYQSRGQVPITGLRE
jgi:hypothetical protein